MRRHVLAGGLALLALGPAALAGAAPAGPVPLTVQAEEGQGSRAAAELGATGLRVQRRDGDTLQVAAAAGRAPALAALPSVASAGRAPVAFGDAQVVSEGLERTGASVFAPPASAAPGTGAVANGGEGLVIAIVDLGFGRSIDRLQADGELPPADRLETKVFDPVAGLAGRNAYGNATNHGELVAQTVYDYAPNARYVFVAYQTPLDFVAAVDWLIERKPDIVVHSNSFIEGPFDGTSPAARAVDRASAAGLLWFNSAGNYAQLHWSGAWYDPQGDGVLDWPPTDGWVFFRQARKPITFALSWASPPDATEPTDLDIAIESLGEGGTWSPVAVSEDRQSAGAPQAERITGHLPQADGFFRLKVTRVSGPEPARLTLFSREIALGEMGGSPVGSAPTPGDAAGAIAVGATDWRGDAAKAYSSQGPTWDGRLKPDISAPTDTRVAGPSGPRLVGGTSNSAPNAAGAAAVLLGAIRRSAPGTPAAAVRPLLTQYALDLGDPGPDQRFGAGRVRVHVTPPRIVRVTPAPNAPVRRVVKLGFRPVSKARLTRWTLSVDGVRLGGVRKLENPAARVDTRRLADGWHLLRVEAADWPGNLGVQEWAVRVDNTPPRITLGRPGQSAEKRPRPARRRTVDVPMRVIDPGTSGRIAVRVSLSRSGGSSVLARRVSVASGRATRVRLGRLRAGSYRLTAVATDRAGNTRTAIRDIRV